MSEQRSRQAASGPKGEGWLITVKFATPGGKQAETFIDEFMEFCGIPSVSEDRANCDHAVAFLVDALERRGCSVQILETSENPVIYGEKTGTFDRAILFYSHYDVVPPGSHDEWASPPFKPQIRDGRIWGRGTADHKGSVLARIHALDLLHERGVELPVSVKFVIEGNEEVGSPGLQQVLESLQGELGNVDGGFYSGWSRDSAGKPRVNGGGRGGCTLQVMLRNADRDLHGAYAPLVRNPLTELIRVLSQLFDRHHQVAVPGFFDDVRPLSAGDHAALESIPFDPELMQRQIGVQRFVGTGTEHLDFVRQHYFGPMLTVYDVNTTGAPGRTVPAEASAFLRASLVPDQDPKRVADLLTRFITANTELPVTVRRVGTWRRPARGELDSTAVQVAIAAGEQVYDQTPILFPLTSGSGPRDIFMDTIGLPLVADVGVSHAGSNDHATNENILVEHYLQGIAYYATVIATWSLGE